MWKMFICTVTSTFMSVIFLSIYKGTPGKLIFVVYLITIKEFVLYLLILLISNINSIKSHINKMISTSLMLILQLNITSHKYLNVQTHSSLDLKRNFINNTIIIIKYKCLLVNCIH